MTSNSYFFIDLQGDEEWTSVHESVYAVVELHHNFLLFHPFPCVLILIEWVGRWFFLPHLLALVEFLWSKPSAMHIIIELLKKKCPNYLQKYTFIYPILSVFF